MAYRNCTIAADGYVHGQHDDYGRWIDFTGTLDGLLVKHVWNHGPSDARARIWQRQDGYGIPGHVPSQGYDWSGIRDSSDVAWAEMVAIAEEYYPLRSLLADLGLAKRPFVGN